MRQCEAIVLAGIPRTLRGRQGLCVPALTEQEVARALPLGTAVDVLMLMGPRDRLGEFDPLATGPWLRDRLARLLERADEVLQHAGSSLGGVRAGRL